MGGRRRQVEAHLEFIRATRRQLADDNGFQAAIVDDGAILGVIGFHRVDWANRSTSIGYWIAAASQGRGLVTEAVRAMTTHAFEVWKLNRVEIRAAPGNARSAAIPMRLGFILEGVLREAERHGDGFKDIAVYSMLAADWASPRLIGVRSRNAAPQRASSRFTGDVGSLES